MLLAGTRGIIDTHIVDAGGRFSLCLHYDADTVTIDDIQRLAAAGAAIAARYGHRAWPLLAVAAEDAGRRIEDTLAAVEGVIAVSASIPAQLA
jgi:Cd2+/Zn2+-exporting ATPase